MVCLVLQTSCGFFGEGPEDSPYPGAQHCQREYLSDEDEVSGSVSWWVGADEVKAGHSLFSVLREMMVLELKITVTHSVGRRICLSKQTPTHIHMHTHTNEHDTSSYFFI